MKTKLAWALAVLTALLSGCVVQCIQPLFAEKEFVPLPDLVGTWEQRDNDKLIGVWTFSQHERRYRLAHADEEGHKATFDVAAGKIGTNVFLDFWLNDLEPSGAMNDLATVTLIAAHAFAKVAKRDGALFLIAMDYEWLEKHLAENPKAIAHVMQNKRPILTASTDELQKFVGNHANDEKVFKNEVRLVRKVPVN